MRKICVLSLAAFCFLTCDFAQSQTVKVPSKWVGGPVILSAGEKGSFDDVAVKDPTIVYYQGKWHLFDGIRPSLDGINCTPCGND